VQEGDMVLMKESGGLVRGSFVVAKVESFENLTEERLKEFEARYSDSLCAHADPQYWQRRRASKYATLMHVAKPTRFKQPFPFPKKDRRGWVVLDISITTTT
jgi:predicted transcriptional regulator